MLLDHIAWAFLPLGSIAGQIIHAIGRLTGPSMAILLGEGYLKTRSQKKYAIRLLVFALISQIPYAFFYSQVGITVNLNMIFTLFLACINILAWDKISTSPILKCWITGIICAISLLSDWSVCVILWALLPYKYAKEPPKMWAGFMIVALITSIVVFVSDEPGLYYYLGIFLVPLVFLLYNRKKVSGNPIHKWFFYAFYPIHLLLLGLILLQR